MAITVLERSASPASPAASFAADARQRVTDPVAVDVRALLAAVEAGLERLRAMSAVPAESLGELDDVSLGRLVSGLQRVESVASSVRLDLTAEADRRRVADRTAETGTDAWVARLTGSTRAQAADGLRIARLLAEKYAATRQAFAAGRLRPDQVRVILHAAEQSPAEATPDQVAAAEEWLVAKATGDGTRSGRPLDAARLRQTARRMFALVDLDLADRHRAILLGRETRSGEVETYLTVHDNGNGTYSGKFMIPELQGAILTQALQRLTAPRRLSRDSAGRLVRDDSAPGTDHGANLYETWGVAFCELIEHLPVRGWRGHAGNNCEVIVTIDHETLLGSLAARAAHAEPAESVARVTSPGGSVELGEGRLDSGIAITPGDARRLACGAALIPAVLDGESRPLDLGRARRLHDRTQRRAYALLHETCAVAGCTRPFAWCEIHHLMPWSHGGPTDLDNGLPLCGHHHRRAHDTRFDLRRHPDGEWAFHRRT